MQLCGSIAFLWDWNKNEPFQSYGYYRVFQICWHIEWNTLTASSFRIWSSSAIILSPPLALFMVMLLKAHLTSHSRISGCWWVFSRILFSKKKKCGTDWHMLQNGWTLQTLWKDEHIQSEMATYYMTVFIWKVQNRQIYRDGKLINSWGEMGKDR